MWYTMIMKNWRLENETKDKADYIILYYHICAGDIGRVGNVRFQVISLEILPTPIMWKMEILVI